MATFGEITGYPAGSWFPDRRAVAAAGVHRPTQAGICGNAIDGAESIVLSGGYEDDEDQGHTILYTGQGGRDPLTGVQIRDQTMDRGNLALARSHVLGLPIRVIRGARAGSRFGPETGYRYDGLFVVTRVWHERGVSGLLVWRFRLEQLVSGPSDGQVHDPAGDYRASDRIFTASSRLVRNRLLALQVKQLHNFGCQFCGLRLALPFGLYAEAAHIQPLGSPHDGPDVLSNLLCLCPNHHILFDLGTVSVEANGRLLGLSGQLKQVAAHQIAPEFLRYHRHHCYVSPDDR